MKAKRILLWALGLSGVALAAATAAVIHEMWNSNAMHLQSCTVIYPQPISGLCEKFFYRYHPTPEEVKELNTAAGAKFAFEAKNENAARRFLKHYLEAGVDINAVDQRASLVGDKAPRDFTALHGAVLRPELMEVKLLLEFGASREVRDSKGRTPLELAREIQAKNPSPQREEVIRLLEAGKP